MQAKQGLWAAVGAGTALAAAGLLVLVSVSVVLAVHGWPQVGKADGPSSVALRAQVAAAARTDSDATAPALPVALPVDHAATRRAPVQRGAARRLPAKRRPSTSRPGASVPAPATAQPG